MQIQLLIIAFCDYSQFMDDNDDAESQKFLSNGMMKKKKYEEYHEEYVRRLSNVLRVWVRQGSMSPVQVLGELQGLPRALFCLEAHPKSVFV